MTPDFWYGVAGVMTLVIIAAMPLLKIFKTWSENRVGAVVNEAQATFYTNLAEQLQVNSKALNQAYNERNTIIKEYAGMEVRVAHLEEALNRYESMAKSLDQKLEEREEQLRQTLKKNEALSDALTAKNNLIQTQTAEIAALTERIHQLELRLAQDESRWKVKGQQEQ